MRQLEQIFPDTSPDTQDPATARTKEKAVDRARDVGLSRATTGIPPGDGSSPDSWLTPQRILFLQRHVGNRAVTRLLAQAEQGRKPLSASTVLPEDGKLELPVETPVFKQPRAMTVSGPGTASIQQQPNPGSGEVEVKDVPNTPTALQRQPKRKFTPTKFSSGQSLLESVVRANPSEEDLAGVCLFLNDLSMADILQIANQIGARNASAIAVLENSALQGYGTSKVRIAFAAVKQKGQISRVGFAKDQALSLGALSAAESRQVLNVIGPEVPELQAMQNTKGFQALTPEEQERLTFLVGGSTTLSDHAASLMHSVLADSRADKNSPATFRKFLKDEKYLPGDVGLPRGYMPAPDRSTAAAPVDVPHHPFGNIGALAADATRNDVTITGVSAEGKPVTETIPVFIPKTAGVKDKRVQPRKLDDIKRMLSAMPDIARNKIVRVDVHWMPASTRPGGSPGKPPETQDDMAAGSDGVLNVYPVIGSDAHLTASLAVSAIHETGHVASIAAWGDDVEGDKWAPWRAAMKSDVMGVSQYGKEHILEDFAESWALYIPAVDTPREKEVRALIPARCKLMDTLQAQPPRH